MTRKLAVARLWYEGNSFSPIKTPLTAFEAREWASGGAAKDFYRGTATEIGAAVEFADLAKDWEVEFLLCTAAPPGGPMARDAFAKIRDTILVGLGREQWHAVYLSLHGATVTEDDPTPELHLLEQVRSLIGRTPLGVSFDLHAHIGQQMLDLIDIAAGYKTYPHIDMAETGAKVIELLTRMVDGAIQPVSALAKIPAILPSFNMRTTDGPMAEMAVLAADRRKKPGILDATVFGGFAYGDSPFAGPSVMVFADGDRQLAQRAADDLSAELAQRRDRFYVTLPSPAEGLATALATPGTKPAAVIDPSDNPLSGGIGDTPELLRALLAAKPIVPTVFGFFWDPPLVAKAVESGVGAVLETRLGGRITGDFGGSVPVKARVLLVTGGKFRNLGPMEHNLPVDLGRTALLDVEGIRVVITDSCQTPNDPGYFALHGIDLGKVGLLCVKAKNHFRAAFKPLTRTIIEIDAPGPASPNLRHYRFKHAPKTLYPLNH